MAPPYPTDNGHETRVVSGFRPSSFNIVCRRGKSRVGWIPRLKTVPELTLFVSPVMRLVITQEPTLAPILVSCFKIARMSAGRTPVLALACSAYLKASPKGIACASRSGKRAARILSARAFFSAANRWYSASLFLEIARSCFFSVSDWTTFFWAFSSSTLASVSASCFFSRSCLATSVSSFTPFITSTEFFTACLMEL